MGEMADYLIDQLFDRSHEEYGDDHYFDPSGVFCKYCHRGPYNWKLTDNGWRLFTQKEKILHHCKAYSEVEVANGNK